MLQILWFDGKTRGLPKEATNLAELKKTVGGKWKLEEKDAGVRHFEVVLDEKRTAHCAVAKAA